ncbi:uncharacterized protein C8Q71DRAFT_787779 [Rhodofomes roseus]|uniref:Transposase DDE domain-containing protein n=1 Tax=Rhodofomes roseus TaxID=34475 RepID=A0ABQ8K0N0_9APHY|nr:uncharacterized protein C8Q71DRAFT_787779 [Rhodofomes roseus]KAH9830206.1 hypothetical protein C8Q71DRAFT_787779 [Rhodofomes roseus]
MFAEEVPRAGPWATVGPRRLPAIMVCNGDKQATYYALGLRCSRGDPGARLIEYFEVACVTACSRGGCEWALKYKTPRQQLVLCTKVRILSSKHTPSNLTCEIWEFRRSLAEDRIYGTRLGRTIIDSDKDSDVVPNIVAAGFLQLAGSLSKHNNLKMMIRPRKCCRRTVTSPLVSVAMYSGPSTRSGHRTARHCTRPPERTDGIHIGAIKR